MLSVYIDGELCGTAAIGALTLKASTCRWNLGRNEEFPGQRIYKGKIDKVKIFVEALSHDEINKIMNVEK